MNPQKPQSLESGTVPSPKRQRSTKRSSPKKAPSPSVSAIVSAGSRKGDAILLRLDIDPEQVALAPKEPSEILTRCLGTSSKLPRERILSYTSVSRHPCAIQFTNAIRRISPFDLKFLSFEAMCVYARVSPVDVMGAVMVSAAAMMKAEGKFKAVLAHPTVVQSTIKAATDEIPIVVTRDGEREIVGYSNGDIAAQRLLHEAVGFLPTKKGGGIEINFGFGRPAEERDEDSDADADWDDAFPPLGDEIKAWSEQKHRLLEGKK